MDSNLDIVIVNVFTNPKGDFGSPTAIIIDEEKKLDSTARQKITTEIGFSETVFVNNLEICDVSIFALQKEIPFAGAPLVGTAWYLSQLKGSPISQIYCQNNKIKVEHKENLFWIRCNSLENLPPWNLIQLSNFVEVENMDAYNSLVKEHTVVWSWIDKEVDKVRVRTFAQDWGIIEEEANGSGSMLLTKKLGQDLLIEHGRGSLIKTRFEKDSILLGGRVEKSNLLYQ